MIAFVTLLLGVAFGVQTIELSAGPHVARVELFIDGTKATELGPPWRATIDLGGEIAPHELVAVALDETGHRLGKDALLNDSSSPPRIAEAIATSSLAATRRERRRAVVLLLGHTARDESAFDAARVRRYLSRLRVPLHVWRVSPAGFADDGAWPGAHDASTIDGLGEAFATLRADLASQRVVWVEGRFLPLAVEVTPEAPGIVTVW